MSGRVEAVNVGLPREVTWHGRTVSTGIWKSPVDGPVEVGAVNLAGDGQADLRVHGGPDKAVYAYAVESYAWWGCEPASFGENLTVSGLDVDHAVVGERWRVGTALLQVCQPRLPCFKLGLRMGDDSFTRRFSLAGRPGAYLRVLATGVLRAGDAVQVQDRPAHGVTVLDVVRAYRREIPAGRLLDAPELTPSWHEWATEHS